MRRDFVCVCMCVCCFDSFVFVLWKPLWGGYLQPCDPSSGVNVVYVLVDILYSMTHSTLEH